MHRLQQARAFITDHQSAELLELVRKLPLMIINVLAQCGLSGHYHGNFAGPDRMNHRTSAGMHDQQRSFAHASLELGHTDERCRLAATAIESLACPELHKHWLREL